MGMEISVIKAKADIDLAKLYSIRIVIDDNFDWYLGDNHDRRQEKYNELLAFAKTLTKEKVLDACKPTDPSKTSARVIWDYLNSIPDDEFAKYIEMVIGSIKENTYGNSHLFFEWNNLPGTSVIDSCSNQLRNVLMTASIPLDNGSHEVLWDTLTELDESKVDGIMKIWKKNAPNWKLSLAKWMNILKPDSEIGIRIVDDIIEDSFGGMISYCDEKDIIYFKNECKKVKDAFEPGYRLWLVSSY